MSEETKTCPKCGQTGFLKLSAHHCEAGALEVVSNWGEKFVPARQYEEMAKLSASQAAAFMILAGVELQRLHKEFDVHAGRQDNSFTGERIKWADLLERHMGVSEATAWRRMQMADAAKKRLPLLQDLPLLETPLAKLPEAQQEQLRKAVHGLVDGKVGKQLMIDWGITEAPKKQKHTPPAPLNAKELVEAQKKAALDLANLLMGQCDQFRTGDTNSLLSDAERRAVLASLVETGNFIRASLKKEKPAKKTKKVKAVAASTTETPTK